MAKEIRYKKVVEWDGNTGIFVYLVLLLFFWIGYWNGYDRDYAFVLSLQIVMLVLGLVAFGIPRRKVYWVRAK